MDDKNFGSISQFDFADCDRDAARFHTNHGRCLRRKKCGELERIIFRLDSPAAGKRKCPLYREKGRVHAGKCSPKDAFKEIRLKNRSEIPKTR